jgi:hypothetical protein
LGQFWADFGNDFGSMLKTIWADFENNFGPILKTIWSNFEVNSGFFWADFRVDFLTI